ncbi:MAG: hypothetical protein VKI42_05090 [Synechococcaceae cyanobacterium]|nr:hypothetical protein [Synechococcaceae cyanobacterium]
MLQPLMFRSGGAGRRRTAGLTGGGVALFGAALLSLPSAGQLTEMQALNKELGKLCSNPPPQARTVCRLHARLVNTLGFG